MGVYRKDFSDEFFPNRYFCGQVTPDDIGRSVQLCGWVDAYQDHGGLLFIHLRDRSGIMQIVFNPEIASMISARKAASFAKEYYISVAGDVKKRLAGRKSTSEQNIEVMVTQLTVLSNPMRCLLPFPTRPWSRVRQRRARAVAED